ncbi:hypothetical protein KPH14_009479 [Odynerus spinipes]|uniref:Uncharacterized protein n=1 Tax=Odynerus spinipes TaxID=1348599 RepID=A0AAD9RQJ5_9HYME|nr:hypothetical protein KPH14_009479 [Odynerus spinipes]
MSALFHVVLAFHACLFVDTVFCAPATYDQRQTGDHNVRIDLKDFKILAFVDSKIVEDYMDYDYFYDFADFTIKPTTSKSTTSSSVEPWHTWPTNPPSSSTTSKIDSEESTSPSNDSTTTSSLSSVQDTTTARIEISTESSQKSTTEDQTNSSSNEEDILEAPKSPSIRGTTKWQSNNRSKSESVFG